MIIKSLAIPPNSSQRRDGKKRVRSDYSRPRSPWRVWSPLLIALVGILLGLDSSAQAAGPDFNQEIRPILSRNCYKCHGPDDEARKASLRLDHRETAIKETESGSVPIVPGRPDDSELIEQD